ncbi:MAG TPA: NAD-dependent epimerase/dehydratase family protein [Pseudonocardia sp.]|jgi:UDP-glucose 4-epimerase/UDP-glucuronate decarboxylase|uniref:NAD-dependent epimerase/dehydratase family protein n=1 Tax=Pseudonocardia sp. TaxID=60912 RepID=UPI002B4B35F2|nr:NAD-dependent epimerase/dehydratase family protein [Pseudonocardia sp.]HLU59333.1 NAD-dependent epimerase/dehydratase family protein [Pseudonocardia sp.]
MRALVLGGAGFIGLHLTRRLLETGRSVTIVDDFSRGRRDVELARLDVPVVHADLTRREAYEELPHGWDEVYMLVAVLGVRNVVNDPARVLRVNTVAVMNLLDWIEPDALLFFASTSETYAGGVNAGVVGVPTPETAPLMVEDVTAPRSTYAISKMWGEAAVVHTAREKGFPFVIGRFHNVYGPRGGTDHVIGEMSARAIRRENPFRVWGADQARAFCYVDDATEAVVRLMGTDAAFGEIVHIGTDTETIIADLAKLVLREADFAPELQVLPAPPGAVARRAPDLTKLRALTGFEPRVPLEEGVRRTFAWYRDSM